MTSSRILEERTAAAVPRIRLRAATFPLQPLQFGAGSSPEGA
ncbi:unnamed protein product [Nezara viridula]|uniref:Uncharacterized protein n=1 Tax=Nezara viridula TaxID=85310 RepID=A0A9P0HS13_NEZVI|nr:unnamed protein product [Nezara viridula]